MTISATTILLTFNYTIIYPLWDIYANLLDGEPLSAFTTLPLNASALIHDPSALYLLLVSAGFWLLSDTGNSTRLLLPGFGGVFYELKDARLCIFWSMMLKRGISEKEIFPLLLLCTDDSAARKDLQRLGKEVSPGIAWLKR